VLEVSNGDLYAVDCGPTGSIMSISGSKITALNTVNTQYTYAIMNGCEIKNSEVRAANLNYSQQPAYSFRHDSPAKVGASLIQGPRDITDVSKIVNCWDENFNPITNQ